MKQAAYKVKIDRRMRAADTEIIYQGLRDFNSAYFGDAKAKHFAVFVKDHDGHVVGGLIAWMRLGLKLLYIDTIWLPEHLRTQGYGTKLMLAAEKEGLKHGCTHAQVDTLPFQAEKFYKKLGYSRIGVVHKLFGEYDYIFLRKDIKA